MRLISEHLRNKKFAFMIDETTDSSGVEQTAVVVRVVDEQLTPEMFLGWHATAKQDSLTLVKLWKTVCCASE